MEGRRPYPWAIPASPIPTFRFPSSPDCVCGIHTVAESIVQWKTRPHKGSALKRDDNRDYHFPRFVSKNAHALTKAAAELRWGCTATSSSMHVLPQLDQSSLLRMYPPTPPLTQS